MIAVEEVQAVLNPYGYTARAASGELFPMFENDLDEADKYELGRTRHNDWRKELYDTLNSDGSTFCVTSDLHQGALIFGVTPFQGNAGRMWMLQSKSFVGEATSVHGLGLVHKMGSATRAMIEVFVRHHSPLFNFIPRSQTRNIRWLKQGGFQFFEHPSLQTDILFFGLGEKVKDLARNEQLWVSCLGNALYPYEKNGNTEIRR